jgi:A/G-specific adenine glycosylase
MAGYRIALPGVSRADDLLSWFDAESRELPWRRSRDPYGVWLSEIMLQQTRVEVALPYYERFLERFPAVEALASADLEEVLALWSGLGYYRRARQLHAAARQIVAAGATFPSTTEELQKLPGIGPYTAAAIASIAFGWVVPVLDGNVERVLSRYLALELDPKKSAARRRLSAAAEALLDPERPGDSNQALMELGATVCKPRAPRCETCPLASGCRARAAGTQEEYPRAVRRKRQIRQRQVCVVATSGSRILLFRRPDDSELLAGIWEIPWVRADPSAPAERRLEETYGGRWSLGQKLGRVRHSITHRALEVEVVLGAVDASSSLSEGREAGWFTPGEIARLPSSSLVGKILRRAGMA